MMKKAENNQKIRSKSRGFKLWAGAVMFCGVFTSSFGLMHNTSLAALSPSIITRNLLCDMCLDAIDEEDSVIWEQAQEEFDEDLDREFKRVERFIVHEMWEQSILPAMMLSAEQFTAVAMQQAMIIGMFIDAETQMDTQRVLQEIQAQAHKDYHPSVGMCEFGTIVKSAAASERRGEVTAVMLAQRSQDRQLGQGYSSGMYGTDLDQQNRIMQYKNLFCNKADRNSALASVCWAPVDWTNASFDADAKARVDKDIDYFSLMDSPWTLNIDFTNQDITSGTVSNEAEEHVLAMGSNLFSHSTFARAPAKLIENRPGRALNTAQMIFMDMRSIVAKRNVAENSFNAIAGMKAEGNSDSTGSSSVRPYMAHLMEELGVPDTDVTGLIGENPSYFAQMELMTKKMYQNPDFYTNLYDKPANVERKAVALQGIKLMQKFDMLKSSLRSEMSTSILLELAVDNLQREIEGQILSLGANR